MVKLKKFLKEIKTILIKSKNSWVHLNPLWEDEIELNERKERIKFLPNWKSSLKSLISTINFMFSEAGFEDNFSLINLKKVKLPKYGLNNEMDNPTLYLILNLTFCLDMSGSRAMSCGKNFSKVDFSIRFRHSVWYSLGERPPLRNLLENNLNRSNSTDLPPISPMIVDSNCWLRAAKLDGSWYVIGAAAGALNPGGGAGFLEGGATVWNPGGGAPFEGWGAGWAGVWTTTFPFQVWFWTVLTGTKLELILLPLAPRLGKCSVVGGTGFEAAIFSTAGEGTAACLLGRTRLNLASGFSCSAFFASAFFVSTFFVLLAGPGFASSFGFSSSFFLLLLLFPLPVGIFFSMKIRSAAVWRFEVPFNLAPWSEEKYYEIFKGKYVILLIF